MTGIHPMRRLISLRLLLVLVFLSIGMAPATVEASILPYPEIFTSKGSPAQFTQVNQPLPGVTYYKIQVNKDGIYQVNYNDLQAAGLPVDTIDPRTFQLFNQGIEVGILVNGEANGLFEAGEYLLFYGQKVNTRYTDTNVYWLTWGAANGLRMASSNGAPSGSASIPAYYLTTARAETDKIYKRELPSGVNADHWYWDGVQSSGSPTSKNFTINLANLASGVPGIKVRGLIKGDALYAKHHTQITLNGNMLDDAVFDVNLDHFFETTIPQSYLVDGVNTFNVNVVVDVGYPGDLVFVNWFEIEYYDKYTAESDLLAFDGDQAGTWEFNVSNFSVNTVNVFDITDPLHPLQISNPAVSSTGSTYNVRFQQTQVAERHYLALIPTKYLAPISISLDVGSYLRNPGNGADWIAISYADFVPAVQPLADFRVTQGYRTKVINVQDIYDEFNGGVFSPIAIRDFLFFAYYNWTPPRPKFVVLVGDGHYDYKNLQGYNTIEYIPPYLADVDPFMSETATDNRFVTLDGNDIMPDIHIGRLPVRSLAETTVMVNKIVGYEQNNPVGGWNANVTFVADDADPAAGDFPVLSDSVADTYLPDQYGKEKIYYGVNYPLDGGSATRAGIISAINAGRLIVSYVGHGSTAWWAAEKLLQVNDIASLTNSDRLSFMLPMTCLEGYFINPYSSGQSLGESIVRADGKGAIASWSPSGQGVAHGHDYLEKGLFIAVFYNDLIRIGEATDWAKDYLADSTQLYHDLIDTYILFGDPATRLQVLPDPTATTVANFTARYNDQRSVDVHWATTLEIGVVGYNLYRADSLTGSLEPVNTTLIPASGNQSGADYSYTDTNAFAGTTYYYLYLISTPGNAESAVDIPPALATYAPGKVFLPIVRR
jgi:hypothetical protein